MPSLREVCLRHARYYLDRLCAIEDEARKGEVEARTSKEEFLDAWEQIQGAQVWAEHRAGQDDAAAAVCSGYAAAASFGVTGATLLDFRQHPVERVRWLQNGLISARRLGDRQAESVHLYDLGVMHVRNHECQRGIDCLEEVLALFRVEKDVRSEAVALNALSFAYRLMHQPRRALETVLQARSIFRDRGNRWDEAFTLCSLGQIYRLLGETSKGNVHLQAAVVIFRDLGDASGEVSALEDLGKNYLAIGAKQRAKECFEQAVARFLTIDNPIQKDLCASSIIATGLAYVTMGEVRAVELLERDLAISREMGNQLGEGFTLIALGWANLVQDKKAAAACWYEQALKVFRRIKYRLGEGFALFHLGVVSTSDEKWDSAVALYKESLAAFVETRSRRGEGDASWHLSAACEQRGERDEAIAWAKAAYRIFEETGHPNTDKVRQKLAEWGVGPFFENGART